MDKTTNSVKAPMWDLSDLYENNNDPQIEKDKEEIALLTDKFIKNYKNKINSKDLTAEKLSWALKDSEKISGLLYKHSAYFNYQYITNTKDETLAKLNQIAGEFSNNISTQLLWFSLEWLHLNDEKANEVMNTPLLERYKHHLATQRIFKPHTLSENEEKIISKLSQTGGSAFVRFYDEIDSQAKYKLKVDGKEKELTIAQLGPYLSRHKERDVRKNAAISLSEGLEKNAKTYTFILNTLLHESKIEDELRKYEYPQQATFMGYEIKPETVKNMTAEIERNYNVCEKFYDTKKTILEYKKLYEWDRYSPIFEQEKGDYTWEETKDIILEAFAEFDPTFYKVGKKFFDEKWIDALIVEGKKNGAMCSLGIPAHHPRILMNFNGKVNDIGTLAHELGHGIHAYLSKNQPLQEFYPSTATAEVASVFAEMVVFDKIYQAENVKEKKVNLLADKIQDSFATIFRQNAFYLFETDIHQHRREKGELGVEEFCEYYQKRLQAMFGSGLSLSKGHRYWWMPVLHFYHYDFYVFTYCMGDLLTTALYGKFKENKDEFKEGYFEALALGGSKDPYKITKIMGVDINSADFWSKGLEILDNYVKEFENLVEK
jgi:oligoendopeptidase F